MRKRRVLQTYSIISCFNGKFLKFQNHLQKGSIVIDNITHMKSCAIYATCPWYQNFSNICVKNKICTGFSYKFYFAGKNTVINHYELNFRLEIKWNFTTMARYFLLVQLCGPKNESTFQPYNSSLLLPVMENWGLNNLSLILTALKP
jgi:hypothetical protein